MARLYQVMRLAQLVPIVDMIFPPRCPLCGDVLARQNGLCIPCWEKLAIPGDPSCQLCQRPLDMVSDQNGVAAEDDGGLICAPCLANPPGHDGISAATLYNDASRELVLSFKYGRRIALGDLLARLIIPRLPVLEGDWLIVPVPLHRWRLWSRGFNQAAILGAHIARATGKTFVPDGLVRRRRTPPLGGLNRRERAKVMAGAISVHPRWVSALKGAQVLLVDDVMTSGATTEACLRALRKAGAARVRIACFARVLDEALPLAGKHQTEKARKKETPGT